MENQLTYNQAYNLMLELFLQSNYERSFLSFSSGSRGAFQPHVVHIWKKIKGKSKYRICVNPEFDHFGNGHFISEEYSVLIMEDVIKNIKGKVFEITSGYISEEGDNVPLKIVDEVFENIWTIQNVNG